MHTSHRPDPRPNSEPNASPNEPNASKNPTAFSVWISNESENTNCLFGTQQHNTAPYQMRSHSLSHLSRYSLGKRSFGRKQFNNLTIIQFLPQSDTESHSDGGDDVRSQSEWESEKLLNGMKIPHQQILCQERFSRWERESLSSQLHKPSVSMHFFRHWLFIRCTSSKLHSAGVLCTNTHQHTHIQIEISIEKKTRNEGICCSRRKAKKNIPADVTHNTQYSVRSNLMLLNVCDHNFRRDTFFRSVL